MRRFPAAVVMVVAAAVAFAAPSPGGAQNPPTGGGTCPVVQQRVEPVVTPGRAGSDADRVVVLQVTIQPSGDVVIGSVEMVGRSPTGGYGFGAASPDILQQGMQRESHLPPGAVDDGRAALDALRAWRFGPTPQPFTTAIGFNLARTEESGIAVEPVRVGEDLRMPRKTRDIPAQYPPDAAARGIQAVTVELTIDQAGIPVSAYAVGPVDGLTMAAVRAALQCRYEPDTSYSRRLMTVPVNFTLSGTPTALSVGGPRGTPPPLGSLAPVRVGGNIPPPRKVKDAVAVLPDTARQAGVRGVVILEIIIDPTGKIQDARVLRSIPLLDQAALDAVRQWEYTPTLLNGRPVPVIMTVTVPFQ